MTSHEDLAPTVVDDIRTIATLLERSGHKAINGFKSIHAFILKYGRGWTMTPAKRIYGKGKMGYCYKNAADLAIDHQSLTYCEGFAAFKGVLPVEHAWCVRRDQTVVDPTWGYDPESEYFGVPIKFEYLREALVENGVYGVIFGCSRPDNPFPILKTPPKEWLQELFRSR